MNQIHTGLLEWYVRSGDMEFKKQIQETKQNFEQSYEQSIWKRKGIDQETFLSEESPVPFIAHQFTKTFEELKVLYPNATLLECTSCGQLKPHVLQTLIPLCDGDESEFSICPDCFKQLQHLFNQSFNQTE